MKREILALKQQIRTLCMLAHATCAGVTLLHSLGILYVSYVNAIMSLISVSTIALCGVLLCTKRHVLETAADYRSIIGKGQSSDYVSEKVYGNEIKALISLVLRDTVAIIASLGLVLALLGRIHEIGQPIPVVTVALRVACVLLILNYAADVALRASFLVMGAYAACSKRTASLGEHEHNLLRNVSTRLQSEETADTFSARDWFCICALLCLFSSLLG